MVEKTSYFRHCFWQILISLRLKVILLSICDTIQMCLGQFISQLKLMDISGVIIILQIFSSNFVDFSEKNIKKKKKHWICKDSVTFANHCKSGKLNQERRSAGILHSNMEFKRNELSRSGFNSCKLLLKNCIATFAKQIGCELCVAQWGHNLQKVSF